MQTVVFSKKYAKISFVTLIGIWKRGFLMEELKKFAWGLALMTPFGLILGGCVLILNLVWWIKCTMNGVSNVDKC